MSRQDAKAPPTKAPDRPQPKKRRSGIAAALGDRLPALPAALAAPLARLGIKTRTPDPERTAKVRAIARKSRATFDAKQKQINTKR